MTGEPRTTCRTPTPGKEPVRIPTWKFEVVRAAILEAVPDEAPGLPFKELPQEVGDRLDAAVAARLGSLTWHTTTVKLELEVRGELARVPGPGAQRLLRRR